MDEIQEHAMTPAAIQGYIDGIRPLINLLEPGAEFYRQLTGLQDSDAIRTVLLLRELRERIDLLDRHASSSLDDDELFDLLSKRA